MDVCRESTYPVEIVDMMGAPTRYMAYLTAGGREMALGGADTETELVTELKRWNANKTVHKLIKDDIGTYENAVRQRAHDSVVRVSGTHVREPGFTVPGKPAPQPAGKQTIPTEKEFYKVEYWQDPEAGRHPASGSGRLPMRETAYLESATVGGDQMWKMHNPATGEDTYFDFDDKEEAIKQFKNLYKKTFGTQKAATPPARKESGYAKYLPGVVSHGAKAPKTRAALSKLLYGGRVEVHREPDKYDVNRRVTVSTGAAFGHVMGEGYNVESAIRSFCLRNQIKDAAGRVIVKMRRDAPKPAPTPSAPPILTAPPELAADVLGAGLTLKAKKNAVKRFSKTLNPNVNVGEYADLIKIGEGVYRGQCVTRNVQRDADKLFEAVHSGDMETVGKIESKYEKAYLTSLKAGTTRDRYISVDTSKVRLHGLALRYRSDFDRYLNRVSTAAKPTAKAAPKRKPQKQPAARKPAPDMPPILTAPPELAADVLGMGPMGLTPTPAAPKPKSKPAARTTRKQPAKLTAEEIFRLGREVADTIGEGDGTVLKPTQIGIKNAAKDIGITQAAARVAIEYYNWGHTYPDVPSVKRTTRKPAAKPKPTAVPKARKPKNTAAAKTRKTTKKAAKPKAKKTAATPKLTASQREYLAIQGFVMVKRGGKYVKITG